MTPAERFRAKVAAAVAAGNVWAYPSGPDKGNAKLPSQPEALSEPEPELAAESAPEPAPKKFGKHGRR